jgi:protein SCO1
MHPTVFSRINVLLLLTCVFSCTKKTEREKLPYYNTPDFTPLFFENKNAAESKVTHRISAFSFLNQKGEPVTGKDMEGKIHVANFIFTSCVSICPVMTKHMKLLQKEFGGNKDVAMLSFSVTPWIDSVGRLKSYTQGNGITAPNWYFLTGNKGEIYKLARQSYFAEEDLGFTKDSTEFLHTEHILLVDKTKRIRGIYNGTLQLEAEQLAKDIEVLLKEEN